MTSTWIGQILDMNKKAFDNSLNVILVLQKQADEMGRVILESIPNFPEEGKQVIAQWNRAYKDGLEILRENVENRFQSVKHYLSVDANHAESSPANDIKETASDLQKERGVAQKPALQRTRVKKTIKRRKADRQKSKD